MTEPTQPGAPPPQRAGGQTTLARHGRKHFAEISGGKVTAERYGPEHFRQLSELARAARAARPARPRPTLYPPGTLCPACKDPEREVQAKGLCGRCYRRQRRQQQEKKPPEK